MPGRWSAVRLGAPLILVCACNAGALERGGPDAGGGVSSIATASDGGASASHGGGVGAGTGVGVGVGVGVGDAGAASSGGSASARTCSGADGSGLPPAGQPAPNVVPTRTPFTCATLPETFIFPPSTLNPPRAYARCASFSVGAATSLSLSPDGRLAAMATADGIARVVELATRQVVAVLASPRAMIDAVAFAPDGRAILTLASAQREATLWRTGDWTGVTRVWTADLPGHRYDLKFGGGIAFAPDGQTAVVSPGTGVFLLDVATGKLRQSALMGGPIMDLAFGLDGRRVVVSVPSLVAHCIHAPNGGVISLLDGNLQGITTLADLGTYPGLHGPPAFRVSPTEDLVLVAPALDEPPGLKAFKLSDGTPLPAPGLDTLPVAFMPDGASALTSVGGALQRVEFPDGHPISATMQGDPAPVAISADGKVVAMAGSGSNLLRTWNPEPGGRLTPVCSAAEPAGEAPVSSLSADGQMLAVGVGANLRVFRRADGARLMSIPMGTTLADARIQLSPRGGYVAIAPTWNAPPTVFAIPNGAAVASFEPDSSGWLDFLFTQYDDKLFVAAKRSDGYWVDAFPFATPAKATSRTVPAYTTILGMSFGCPVLYSSDVGAWRSCGTCDDPPIAGAPDQDVFGPDNAVLSGDGMFVAIAGAYDGPGVTLWRLRPDPAALVTIPRRADEAAWDPQEYPVAITPGGARILTGARIMTPCFQGPEFEVQVRDGGTGGTLVDSLPPGVTSVDAAVRTIAYGAQLWCAQ